MAAIFHWPDDRLDAWTVEDLMRWRHIAIERAKILGLVKAD